MSCHGATKVSPYQIVYGHEAVLPWETRLGSRRVTFQYQLTAEDYATLMKDELEDLAGHQLNALINIEANTRDPTTWDRGRRIGSRRAADAWTPLVGG